MPVNDRARCTPPHTMRAWPLPKTTSPVIERLRQELKHPIIDSEISASLTRWRHKQHARTESIRQFAEWLQMNGTPIVEPDDDERFALFTFVHIGETPHGVVLQLNKVSDPLDIEDTLLERIERTELFTLTLRLPARWQGSYNLAKLPHRTPARLHEGPDRETMALLAEHAMTDSWARELLPVKAPKAAHSTDTPRHAVARGPHAPTTQLWRHEPPHTMRLADVQSPVNGEPLRLDCWSSPNATEHSPVVLFTDGEVWRTQYPVATEISQRVDRGEMEPVHLLFLDSASPRQRSLDYTAPWESTRSLLDAVRESARGVCQMFRWYLWARVSVRCLP